MVALASGRHYNNMKKLLPLMKDKAYFISDSGSTVIYKGEVLLKHHVNENLIREIIKYLHDTNCEVALSNDVGYFTEERDEYINANVFANVEEVGYIVESVEPYLKDVTKLTVMAKDSMEDTIKYLNDKYGDILHIVQSGSIWIDITKNDVNKGEAVKLIQEKLGIKKEETVGFGNSENDIPLLLQCGEAIVVDDSNDNVKSFATKIVADVYHDGALKEIKNILNAL